MESKPAAPALCTGPSPRPAAQAQAAEPAVRFSPYAWAKMLCLRDAGPSEVGGLGLCRDGQDPLAVHDAAIPRQFCSQTATCLDDDAVSCISVGRWVRCFHGTSGMGFPVVSCGVTLSAIARLARLSSRGTRQTHFGRCLAIVRARRGRGGLRVRATSESLTAGEVRLRVE